jgi:hypothetical protein
MEYFLALFDNVDGICQEYSLSHWTESLLMWQNILPHVSEWMKNIQFFWMKKYEKCHSLKKFGQHR